MTLDELKKNWDEYGKKEPLHAVLTEKDNWNKEKFFLTGVKEIKDVMDHIEGMGLTVAHNRALDFGCGVGRLTQALATYFDEAYGVDIAPSFIDLARAYNTRGDKCSYYLNARDDLSLFADQTFDFIYSARVLQHMNRDLAKKYIGEFVRLLKPHGILVFQIPCRHFYSLRRSDRSGSDLSLYIPNTIFDLYWKIRFSTVNRGLKMELHGHSKDSIVAFMKKHHVKQLDIVPDDKMIGWEGFCYYFSKELS